ncbi:uncharacterized protein ACOB8E_020605 isoform 2-T2 [Sarcophilus harrisii]
MKEGTFCIPCDPGTYITHKHVLKKCLPCKVCDTEFGLVTRRECSSTSNTMCGCSPGYFCIDMKDDDCELCAPHQVCNPGQYVKSKGTERKNTICENCQAGTFSMNGTLNFCLPWTNNPVIISISIFFIIMTIILILRCRKKNTQDREIPIEAQPSKQTSNNLVKTPFLKTLPGDRVATPAAARSRVLDSPIIYQKDTTNDEIYRASIFLADSNLRISLTMQLKKINQFLAVLFSVREVKGIKDCRTCFCHRSPVPHQVSAPQI